MPKIRVQNCRKIIVCRRCHSFRWLRIPNMAVDLIWLSTLQIRKVFLKRLYSCIYIYKILLLQNKHFPYFAKKFPTSLGITILKGLIIKAALHAPRSSQSISISGIINLNRDSNKRGHKSQCFSTFGIRIYKCPKVSLKFPSPILLLLQINISTYSFIIA